MLSIDDALKRVLENSPPLPAIRVPLADALGRVLAEAVATDMDSPPHDQSIVDGFAIDAADLATGTAEFEVLEEITAGLVPACTIIRGTAAAIMTGAPVPPGASAVIMVERSEPLPASAGRRRVRLTDAAPAAGQNIRPQGASMRRGEVVLQPGKELRAIEVGLLAEVGCTAPLVVPQPRVAVLATGNELVPPHERPAPGKIRNSNSSLLGALVERSGGRAELLGIAPDVAGELRQLCAQGLAADVLLLSGGVSAGVLDLVPQILVELGVTPVFHKVRIKPGQPLWFGVKLRPGGAPPALVFGLPGNPVSSLVCFEVFVRPALARLQGHSAAGLRPVTARLTRPHAQRGARPTYWPAHLEMSGEPRVEPLAWKGSGDLRTLTGANALAFFPSEGSYAVGDAITAFWL